MTNSQAINPVDRCIQRAAAKQIRAKLADGLQCVFVMPMDPLPARLAEILRRIEVSER